MQLKIDKFLLWRVKEQESVALNSFFEQIASFFDLEQVNLSPMSLSFKEAIYLFAKELKLKPMALIKEELCYNVPIIARDKKLDRAVLLLPLGEHFWVNDLSKSYTVSKKKAVELFDEHILLFPLMQQKSAASPLWCLGHAALALVFLTVSLFCATSIFSHQKPFYWALAAIFCLGFASVIGELGFKASIKYYGRDLYLKLHSFYSYFLSLPEPQFLKTSPKDLLAEAQSIKQALHDHYFNRFLKVFSIFSVLAILLFLTFWHFSLVPFLLSALLLIFFFSWLLQNLGSRLSPKRLTHQQELALSLEQYRISFSTIAKLKAFEGISHKLLKQKSVLDPDEQKLSSIKYWQKSARFYGPFLTFLAFSWWRFLEPELSLERLIFLSTAAIFLGLLMAIATETLFNEPLPATLPQTVKTHVEPVNIKGAFELIGLSFSYPESHLIFKNYNLNLLESKFYGIAGPSGLGKSTLLKLLLGFLRPTLGQVVIDGQDLRSLNLSNFRKNFGVIFDDSNLFMGSVYDNIMCGRDIKPKALEHLLLSHEIFDTILDMPMGVQSFVFWHQKNLSHLEKAVILLARALVHDPQILIMDEFINNLSFKDQVRIAEYLASLSITRILVSNSSEVLAKTEVIRLG